MTKDVIQLGLTNEEVNQVFAQAGHKFGFWHTDLFEPAYLLCKCGKVTFTDKFKGHLSCQGCMATFRIGTKL